MTDRQVRVLLSGGIGSGKSTVGEMLRARGALVIDADEVGHLVLAPDGDAFGRVAENWPSVVVDGAIDRNLLADIVFRDSDELERLEEVTHAAIRSQIASTIEESTQQVVVVEVPLLSDFLGPGWLRVVVDAEPATRLHRLLRRGMDEQDALRRMAAQPGREEWSGSAQIVIGNSGDRAQLERQVDRLWRRLMAILASQNGPQSD